MRFSHVRPWNVDHSRMGVAMVFVGVKRGSKESVVNWISAIPGN